MLPRTPASRIRATRWHVPQKLAPAAGPASIPAAGCRAEGGESEVAFCVNESGPLNLMPYPRRLCRYLRTFPPPTVRIAIVCDSFSPVVTTKKYQRVTT